MARSATVSVIEFTVDEEFANLLPRLTNDEQEGLRTLLKEQGWQDTVKIWKGHDVLLDGHHRIELCEEEGIECEYEEIDLPDRKAAKLWIIRHARGQRNLTPDQQSYLRGKQYELEKGTQGGDRKSKGQNDPLLDDTAERLADEHSVSPKTIKRDAEFAVAVDTIADSVGPGVKQEILSGDLGLTKKDVTALAELPKPEQKKAVKGGKEGIKETLAPPKPTKTFPASDTFMAWMASLSGVRTKIKQDYGSFKKMIAHKGWEKARTPAALDLLKRVRDGLDTLYKEATKP